MNPSKRIDKARFYLIDYKAGRLSLKDKEELKKLLNEISQDKFDQGDTWGSLVCIGMVGQIK